MWGRRDDDCDAQLHLERLDRDQLGERERATGLGLRLGLLPGESGGRRRGRGRRLAAAATTIPGPARDSHAQSRHPRRRSLRAHGRRRCRRGRGRGRRLHVRLAAQQQRQLQRVARILGDEAMRRDGDGAALVARGVVELEVAQLR